MRMSGNTKIKYKMKVQDFMPGWKKEEECYKEAIMTDYKTHKQAQWPRMKPVRQMVYENWLERVIDENSFEWNPQRDRDGTPVKNTGAKYVIHTIVRVKVGKNEFLYSKEFLKGFDAGGGLDQIACSFPERWTKTNFAWKRVINEKTMGCRQECQGPAGDELVYDMPFTPENVQSLFDKVEDENVQFVVKDDRTGEAFEVKWSSVNETLKLFKEKSWEYLRRGEYIPAPVKAELRAEAEAKGLVERSHRHIDIGRPTQSAPELTTLGFNCASLNM
jgi:hypothetical protein